MNGNILELAQKICKYKITKPVQKIEFDVNINTLRTEILDFIKKENFGFSTVSLRLPKNFDNYTSKNEYLESDGIQAFVDRDQLSPMGNESRRQLPNEFEHASYNVWHPRLENSYVSSLVPELENLSGFKISKVRLGWLRHDSGYPMHSDLDPLRFHIPIITNKNAYIMHGHELFHMEYGQLYHLLPIDVHTAWNFGALPRLHLIFSTYHPEFEELLQSLTQIDYKIKNLNDQFLNCDINIEILKYLAEISNVDSEEYKIANNIINIISKSTV